MWKIKPFLLVCSLLLFFVSCDNEPEKHELTPVEQPIILYADQTVDSLLFYTYDSWTVTPQVDWIRIDGNSHVDLKYDYRASYLCRVFVSVKPNATGRTRTGTVLVQSYEYSYSSPLVQLGMFNISHPAFTGNPWLDERSNIPDVARFELVDSALWTSDSICFTVEDNWDLVFAGETAPDWLSLDRKTGLRGKYKVNLTLTPNVGEKKREAVLLLISGGIVNEIVVCQLPLKEEKDKEKEEEDN